MHIKFLTSYLRGSGIMRQYKNAQKAKLLAKGGLLGWSATVPCAMKLYHDGHTTFACIVGGTATCEIGSYLEKIKRLNAVAKTLEPKRQEIVERAKQIYGKK